MDKLICYRCQQPWENGSCGCADGCCVIWGDCREALLLLAQGAAQVVVTDPPYGIDYVSNKSGERWRAVKSSPSWAGESILGDATIALRDWVIDWGEGMPMLVFGSWKIGKPIRTKAVLIWDKGPQAGMGDLAMPWKPSWEEIYVLGRGFSGNRDEGVIKGFTEVSWESHGRFHPTQKPVTLMSYLIAKSPCGLVLDPFLGGGSTAVAAKMLGRRCIGIELEEAYVKIACRRLDATTPPLPLLAKPKPEQAVMAWD